MIKQQQVLFQVGCLANSVDILMVISSFCDMHMRERLFYKTSVHNNKKRIYLDGCTFPSTHIFYETPYEEHLFLPLRKDCSYVDTITAFESKSKNAVGRTTGACAKYNSELII